MSGPITDVSVTQLSIQLSGTSSVHSFHDADANVELGLVPLSEGGKSTTNTSNNHDEIKDVPNGFSSSTLKSDKSNRGAIVLERRSNSLLGLELARTLPLPPSTSTIYLQNNTSVNVSRSRSGPRSRSIDVNLGDSQPEVIRTTSALAPVDGGFGAWSYLFAAFLVQNIALGFPNAFGVFLDAYLKDPRYTSQKHANSLLPLIGTLTTGIMYCSGPVTYPLIYRYPHYRRPAMWLGALICWASLFGASYTTRITSLVLCQGVLYAIGGAMLYNPCIYYMSEWFVARRGLASGVIYAGTSTGGLFLPLVLPDLLEKYGSAVTLRILAVAFLCGLLPFLPFLRGRLPAARVYGPTARSTARSALKDPTFQFIMLTNTLQGFGYFIPVVFLPTFATELRLSATNSSLALALLNGASIVGRLVAGHLSDTVDPWLLALSTLFGTCISTFVLWGVLGHTFTGLIAFGLVYGVLAGGWSSLWTGFIKKLAVEDPQLSTTLIGYLMFSRGLGNILSTPIATALSRSNSDTISSLHERLGFDVGGGKYERVIVYVGTCFAGAAIIALVAWGIEKARLRPSRGI